MSEKRSLTFPQYFNNLEERSFKTDFVKKEYSHYCQIGKNTWKFSKEQLNTLFVPKNLLDDTQSLWMNVSRNYQTFQTLQFPRNESTIKNLLISLTYQEYQDSTKSSTQKSGVTSGPTTSIKDQKKPRIISHNGLAKDIVLGDGDVYEIVPYQGQLIFASTNRRLNQDRLSSYTGIRFEDLLKIDYSGKSANELHELCQKNHTKDNFSHFKRVFDVEFKKTGLIWRSSAEIDGLDETATSKEAAYVEVKLTCHYRHVIGYDRKELLANVFSSYPQKLTKWVLQCSFSGSDKLIMGVRTSNYSVQNVQIYQLEELVEFLKEISPTQYRIYATAIDKVESVFKWIDETVQDDCVYTLSLDGPQYRLTEHPSSSSIYDSIKDNVLTKTFWNWRNHGVIPDELKQGELDLTKESEPKMTSKPTISSSDDDALTDLMEKLNVKS
ncbi:hypothetical protein CANARDRAFT_29555 [[Candida] arabinofermentans NRRL YB-2248]|uniref:Decapping nuclease n=1 Tax=[Candida] arabinofermentans NRRL YB-2248 TaxID=983967 RepID=A0A1E4SWJ1_9ASCO|nr:hypothetical protein CANARDRAFT_29555 [[Candida] arabinofermentans NRRL YB-2248]